MRGAMLFPLFLLGSVFWASPSVPVAQLLQKKDAKKDEKKREEKGSLKEFLLLQSKVFTKPKMRAVPFFHRRHAREFRLPCTACHHRYEDGKNVWEKGDPAAECGSCHRRPGSAPPGAEPEEKRAYLMEMFHQSCQGCHREVRQKKRDAKAPLLCTRCHTRVEKDEPDKSRERNEEREKAQGSKDD